VYRPPFSVKVEFVTEETEPKPSKQAGTVAKKKVEKKTPPLTGSSQSEPRPNPKSSSNSLLRRRTAKALGGKYPKNPKSELQILIPKMQEEEESTTPQPLTS